MKFALITGASSGIGAEYARQLARKGHNIIAVSNQREQCERNALRNARSRRGLVLGERDAGVLCDERAESLRYDVGRDESGKDAWRDTKNI